MHVLLTTRLIFLSLFSLMAAELQTDEFQTEKNRNHGFFSRVCAFFSRDVSRIAPDPEDVYQRLSNPVSKKQSNVILKILKNEHDSLRSTQQLADLAISACARFGDANLFHSYIKDWTVSSFCCFPCIGSSHYTPSDEAIKNALTCILKTREAGRQKIYLAFGFLNFQPKILFSIIKEFGEETFSEIGIIKDDLIFFNNFYDLVFAIDKDRSQFQLDEETKRLIKKAESWSEDFWKLKQKEGTSAYL